MPLTDAEARTLGAFRNFCERADVDQLLHVVTSTLDAAVDALRAYSAGNIGTEMAAALAAELHKRGYLPLPDPGEPPPPPPPQRSPLVGNA